KPMAKFSEVAHKVLYGRPLWEAYSKREEEQFNNILIRHLLCNFHSHSHNFWDRWRPDPANPRHVFAVVAVRAVLEPIIGAQVSMTYLKETVVKHLCPVKEFDAELGVIQVDQYMDPSLAGAVTWALFTGNGV